MAPVCVITLTVTPSNSPAGDGIDAVASIAPASKLAQANLEKYPPEHEHLNLVSTRGLIQTWLADLERARFEANPLNESNAPKLNLLP